MKNTVSWNISKVFAFIIGFTGLFTAWCWLFDQSETVHMHPDIYQLTFNTAICYSLTGLVYLLQSNSSWSKLSQLILGNLLLMFGALILIEYYFNVSLGIDEFFVKVKFTEGIKNPGRMSSLTATAFCTAGSAIILLYFMESSRSTFLIYVLILTTFLMGALGIIQSEIFSLSEGKLNVNRIAYHSSLCLMLFSCILLINWYHACKEKGVEFTNEIIGNLVKLTIIYFALVVGISSLLIALGNHH
jgi:hypothetical protein